MRADEALKFARRAGGTLSSADLVRAGLRWEDLYRLRDEGSLVELSRGVYRLADAAMTAHLDLVAVCRRAPDGTICLASAASYWDLTDEVPEVVHLAVARGCHVPRIAYPPTQVHTFAAATFRLGRLHEELESGEIIVVSSRERTVVDLLRNRGRVGRDQAFAALRRYLEGPSSDPAGLLVLARQLRAGTVVADALEHLLA